MYSIYADNLCIYDDISYLDNTKLIDPTLDLEENAAGSLTMSIPITNIGYEVVERLKSVIVVKKNYHTIWVGRVISENVDWNSNRKVTCEGALAYLNDIQLEPQEDYKTDADGNKIYNKHTSAEMLSWLVNTYNSQIDDGHKLYFRVGTVNYRDGEKIFELPSNYQNGWDYLSSAISNNGGHMTTEISEENGTYVIIIHYLNDYILDSNPQKIEFGINLLDYSRSFDLTEFYTAIIPLGDTVNNVQIDVSSVNGGSKIVRNEGLISQYGYICKVVSFPGVTDANELMTYAKSYLENTFADLTLEVKVIDFQYLDKNSSSINILHKLHVISPPHYLDAYFPVTKVSIPFNNIANMLITLNGHTSGSTISSKAFAWQNEVTKTIKLTNKQLLTLRGITITKDDYYYTLSDSATDPPGDSANWTIIPPVWKNGWYMWQKRHIIYADGVVIKTDPINISGATGASPEITLKKEDGVTTINVLNPDGSIATTKIVDGEDGTPGRDGNNNFIHVKYSNDGGITFTENHGENPGDWIGTCTDQNKEDPITVDKYTWSKIKGDKPLIDATKTGRETTITADGEVIGTIMDGSTPDITSVKDGDKTVIYSDGEPIATLKDGKKGRGITGVVTEYYVSDSNTTQIGGSWGPKIDRWGDNLYVWSRERTSWDDGESDTTTAPVLNIIETQMQSSISINNETIASHSKRIDSVANQSNSNETWITQNSNSILMTVDTNGNLGYVNLSAEKDDNGRYTSQTEFKVKASNLSLSADDTINLMSGGSINLTSKNISINSPNFKVDTNGNITANNATFTNGKFTGSVTTTELSINGLAKIYSSSDEQVNVGGALLRGPAVVFTSGYAIKVSNINSPNAYIKNLGSYSMDTTNLYVGDRITVGENNVGGQINSVKLIMSTLSDGVNSYIESHCTAGGQTTNNTIYLLRNETNFSERPSWTINGEHRYLACNTSRTSNVMQLDWGQAAANRLTLAVDASYIISFASDGSTYPGSDRRLKHDIKHIDRNFVKAVSECDIKEFEYNACKGTCIGIIAQDLKDNLVKYCGGTEKYNILTSQTESEDDNTEYLHVGYQHYIIAMLQYFKDENKELKRRLKEVEEWQMKH